MFCRGHYQGDQLRSPDTGVGWANSPLRNYTLFFLQGAGDSVTCDSIIPVLPTQHTHQGLKWHLLPVPSPNSGPYPPLGQTP